MEERVYPCVSDREFDSCKMGQIVRDAIVSWWKKRVLFNFWGGKIDLRFLIFYSLCLLFWNGKHKWNESGPNLVNYTGLVFETIKLTKLYWPCVYGVAETKRIENEQGKSFSNLNETINKKQNESKYLKLRKQTFW